MENYPLLEKDRPRANQMKEAVMTILSKNWVSRPQKDGAELPKKDNTGQGKSKDRSDLGRYEGGKGVPVADRGSGSG